MRKSCDTSVDKGSVLHFRGDRIAHILNVLRQHGLDHLLHIRGLPACTMADVKQQSDSSLIVVLVLLYAALGPLGLLPAALGIAAIVLARSTTFLQFVLDEHEHHHGKNKGDAVATIKSELLQAIREDISARIAIETSGLKAQISLIGEQLKHVQNAREKSDKSLLEAKHRIVGLQIKHAKLEEELDDTKFELACVKSRLQEKREAEKCSLSGFQKSASLATESSTVSATQTIAKGPTIHTANHSLFGAQSSALPALAVSKPPEVPSPLKIQLPAQLQSLDPTGSGFKCIGRALASHGGPCGSFSNELLPESGRNNAAATLREIRSAHPDDKLFELPALRNLANDMLCIRHRRGVRYDQSGSIAEKWHKDLAEQVRTRREAQKVATSTPVKAFSAFTSSTIPTTLVSPFGSRPASPASSVGSVSTAATTPETFDGRSKTEGGSKPVFDFGTNQSFSFGTPTPGSKDVYKF